MERRSLHTSKLTHIYVSKQDHQPRLAMAQITGFEKLQSFEALRDHVLITLRYPTPQASKLETYGWVPTLYASSERTFKNHFTGESFTRDGSWRNGATEAGVLSAFYADIDNDNANRPFVSIDVVSAALDKLGLRFFAYTSYSHSPEKPKFRVVVETDRDLDRSEMLRLAVHFDFVAFGQQSDLSIYDPGDFLFAPPYGTTTVERMDGKALCVDDSLELQTELMRNDPERWSRYVEAKEPKVNGRDRTSGGKKTISNSPRDLSVRADIHLQNWFVFNPVWRTFYEQTVVAGSHWKTMRSLLGMIWAKNQGRLTYGEMDHLFREIDATGQGYFMQHHGEPKASELIQWTMSLPIEAEQDWHPLVEREETGLTILAKEAECGEGKTRDHLQRMAREKGRYVYVVDKIANIEMRRQEFYQLAGTLDAIKFFVREAHSKNHDLRVPLQLYGIRRDLNKEPAGRPAIVFVTQQGAMQMDWSHWEDSEIILDEVPDIFATYKIKVKNHAALLRTYIETVEEDGNCYRLGLTSAGDELARSFDFDDYDAVHHGLCVMMAKPNTLVWAKKKGWDDPSEGGRLEFFAITSPLNMRPFSKVWMLGDELTKSVTAKVWRQKWGVEFESVAFERRLRTVPTKDRVSINYFSDHRDSSLTRFREGDLPLPAVTDWVKAHSNGSPVLWTANEKLMDRSKLPTADYISPKAHGRNDLQHYTHVAWLAAMKASKFEIGTLREVCGMTAQELTDWREFNAMYQFVMRSIHRDFGSAVPVVIYVFSRKQAEYLQGRLGGTVHKAQGVIIDEPARCIDQDGAMTPAERQKAKYYREKMIKAGVSDVRNLPKKASKLSEREIRLINATFERAAGDGNDADRLAA